MRKDVSILGTGGHTSGESGVSVRGRYVKRVVCSWGNLGNLDLLECVYRVREELSCLGPVSGSVRDLRVTYL